MQTNFFLSWPIYWIREFESKVLKSWSNELMSEKFSLPAFCIKKLISKGSGVWWESIDAADILIKKLRTDNIERFSYDLEKRFR